MKSPLPCQSSRDSERVSGARFAKEIHQWRSQGRQDRSFVSKIDTFVYLNTCCHRGRWECETLIVKLGTGFCSFKPHRQSD